MEYDVYFNQLMYLKNNTKNLTDKARLQQLIRMIGNHPDALQMYKDMFLSPQQANQLVQLGINGSAVAKNILENCEIRTTNSTEIAYRYYGYAKKITPATLNQFIDDIATRIQLENEYSRTAHIHSPQEEKEDELVLDEICTY